MRLTKAYTQIRTAAVEATIFCDMDGVLVHFAKGIKEVVDAFPPEDQAKFAHHQGIFHGVFDKLDHAVENGHIESESEFWENLEWMPDGKELWDYLKPYNPFILTGLRNDESEAGKREWCKRELGIQNNRVLISEHKATFVAPILKAGKRPILIDDWLKNIIPWREAGGLAIHHSSAEDTVKLLQALGI